VIQHPGIISLSVASLLVCMMLLYAGWYGLRILTGWDLNSGSEKQLKLERRTYLVSVVVSYALMFQIISLFLFIFTADNLHSQFVGAMCAAGCLSINGYGYPALIMKILNCLLSGAWLIINHADTKGYDYPLIKSKYSFLLFLVPLFLLETGLQLAYFANLKADVITSCCGSLFSAGSQTVASDLAGLPAVVMMPLFYGAVLLSIVSAFWFYFRRSGGYLLSALSVAVLIISLASLISFISLYYYELPTHHCPFCILQKEYGYIGYFLYATLLAGTISGIGIGILMPFRHVASLQVEVVKTHKLLSIVFIIMTLLFTAAVSWQIYFSSLRL
jgi:hypothetical protein